MGPDKSGGPPEKHRQEPAGTVPLTALARGMRSSSKLRLYNAAIGLMRPLLRSAWEILRLATQSRTPADKERPLAVVIHSFDGYKRFWPAARYFTERAIPAGFPIYYISERVAMHPDPSRCILTGHGGFSTRLARGLDVISRSHRYVLYLQEDIWLDHPLSEADLRAFLRRMDKEGIDCLKLGWRFWPGEREVIVSRTDSLPDSGNIRWYGPHRFSMSHHCSIFRSDYFWRTALFARLFRQERPLRNEFFISEALKGQIKARNSDRKKIRVAIWEGAPLVSYTHACIRGRLTPEGRVALEKHDISHLYDESLAGEILPAPADMLQIAR